LFDNIVTEVLNHAKRYCANGSPTGLFIRFQLLDEINVDTHIPRYDVCILDVPLIAMAQSWSDADTMNTSRFAFGGTSAV
jgi:hypothetical protein